MPKAAIADSGSFLEVLEAVAAAGRGHVVVQEGVATVAADSQRKQ